VGAAAVTGTEFDALMLLLGERGFVLHSFRADLPGGPEVLAAVLDHGGAADVVLLFGEDHAVAYRTPSGPGTDLFTVTRVHWSYAAPATWTLRALLTLPPPWHPDAPQELTDAPPGVGLPQVWRARVRLFKRRPDHHGP
jgi:hypothetical protein